MTTLILIGVFGAFMDTCRLMYRDFNGSSYATREIIGLIGNFGNIIYYGLVIASFWLFTWWQPIVIPFAIMIIGPIILNAIYKLSDITSIIVTFLAPIGSLVFAVLSIISVVKGF